MPRFLSDEWLAALGEVAAGLAPAPDGRPSFALGQLVTGAPGGDMSYTIVLGAGPDGDAGCLPGLEAAEVVLIEDYDTARALAAGETSAGEALAAGHVKVRGDANRLVESQDLLAELAGALDELRATTTF